MRALLLPSRFARGWAILLAFTLGIAITTPGLAQVVSSNLIGSVRDSAGRPVANATVTAVHVPTGTTYTANTSAVGRFNIRGMVVGGPYTIRAEADGFQTAELQNVQTTLGTDADVSLSLTASEVVAMEAFRVEATADELNAGATGAGTVLDSRRIEMQPTINRSFADMIRTNPFVTIRSGAALTALGMNNRFNSVTVDGARINDQFGLNASGLQSFNNPFALDALEQFSVSLAPYEARRSGFTGAAIDAVTRSGTNEFRGSAYYIFTNAGLQGKDVAGTTRGTRPVLDEETYGFTLGGPIIRNRLFFFANYEKYTRESAPSNPGFTPEANALSTIMNRLGAINTATGYNTDFGSFGGTASNVTDDEKRLLKLDWNINRDHRFTIRYSDTVGTQPSFGAFNANNFSGGAPLSGAPPIGRATALSSNFWDVERTEKVWATQLFSNWTADLRTELSYSKTSFDQDSLPRAIFPEVRIYNVPGVDFNGNPITNGVLALGTENSRHGNVLRVDTESYAGSADYTWRNYTITGGFDREESSFYNLFRQSSYGVIGFNGIQNFVNDVPFAYFRSVAQEGFEPADISEFRQTGFFSQVRTDVSHRFNYTLGLRYDLIESPIAPPTNHRFVDAFGISNAGTIDGSNRISPRASFNLGLDDERMTQVRGGAGVFLGRAPWVIFSNSYGNTGVGRFTESATGANAPKLVDYLNTRFDPENPIGIVPQEGGASVINLTQDGTKLPAIMRANLAVDRRLPFLGATFSLEYVHTEVLEALFIDNINLRPTTVGADGRQRFAGAAGAQPLVPGFGNVLRIRNTGVGSSQYWNAAIDRPLGTDGWAYGASYTRGRSTEAQALGSSTAGSQWQFNAVFNQNQVEESRSDFEIRNRLQVYTTKRFTYGREMATSVSLYYEGRTGSPYSWVYSGDLNTDGFNGNDLVAVPTGANDPRFDFSGLNAAQLDAYLRAFEQHGLNPYAGSHAPRNTHFQPWQNRLDLRIMQEIPTFRRVRVELFADFINFGSWISESVFNYIETMPNPNNAGLVRQLGNATYTADGRIRPTVSLDADGNVVLPANSTIAVNNAESRWRLQFGARIRF
jgi:hypothetical protein